MLLLLGSFVASAGAELDPPTCFPITAAVMYEVEAGNFPDAPIYIEEDSWCPKHSVRRAPRVPAGPVGRERLQFILDALNRPLSEPPLYEVVPRVDGWLIAPVGRAHLSDALVTIDLKSGLMMERALAPILAQVGTPIIGNIHCGCDTFLEGDVKLESSSLVAAFRALYGKRPVGFAIKLGAGPGPAPIVTFSDPNWGL